MAAEHKVCPFHQMPLTKRPRGIPFCEQCRLEEAIRGVPNDESRAAPLQIVD